VHVKLIPKTSDIVFEASIS